MPVSRVCWLLMAAMLWVHPVAAQRRAPSSSHPPPTAPSVGAPSRAPSFWRPDESGGVPITNRLQPPCLGDDCRMTALVGGLLAPQLYTRYSPPRKVDVTVIWCRDNDQPPIPSG